MTVSLIFTYMAKAYQTNPEAEVSGLELQHELGLDASTVERCIGEMAEEGLVEWDPLLHNVWLRLSDKGIALVERGVRPARPADEASEAQP
jgi:DNA-binding MarR family transcriptional regulator